MENSQGWLSTMRQRHVRFMLAAIILVEAFELCVKRKPTAAWCECLLVTNIVECVTYVRPCRSTYYSFAGISAGDQTATSA